MLSVVPEEEPKKIPVFFISFFVFDYNAKLEIGGILFNT